LRARVRDTGGSGSAFVVSLSWKACVLCSLQAFYSPDVRRFRCLRCLAALQKYHTVFSVVCALFCGKFAVMRFFCGNLNLRRAKRCEKPGGKSANDTVCGRGLRS
jgi:hypothetical protein